MKSALRILATAIALGACAVLSTLNSVVAQGPARVLRIWAVGSPDDEDVPGTDVPPALLQEAARRGISLKVTAFPARNFASVFAEALARNAAPDLLVISNMGIIEGMVIDGRKFDGVAEDPLIRQDLVQVTGVFDALLPPSRGWTFLFSRSANYDAARQFALAQSTCPRGFLETALPADVGEAVAAVVSPYLRGDATRLLPHTDPERLASGGFLLEARAVGTVRSCSFVATDRLAFVLVHASYEAERKIGQAPVALVFRKQGAVWQLLVAARDPITTGPFMKGIASLAGRLGGDPGQSSVPTPVSLLSPADGQFPVPRAGQRFGAFTWRSNARGVPIEIGEFAYQNDARLILQQGGRGFARQISAGQLWTTRNAWHWRIWSVTREGAIAFSESRSFTH